MKSKVASGLSVGLLLLGLVGMANASIIWDASPDFGATVGASVHQLSWSNISNGQNFAENVLFAGDFTVTGMDIYSDSFWGSIGDTSVIRIWSGVDNIPTSLLFDLTVPISAIDTMGTFSYTGLTRKHVDFSPINLSAGGYWFGMSAIGQLAQASIQTLANGHMARFSGAGYSDMVGVGDMAFRLHGEMVPVPEPNTLLLLGTGLAGLMVYRRKAKN